MVNNIFNLLFGDYEDELPSKDNVSGDDIFSRLFDDTINRIVVNLDNESNNRSMAFENRENGSTVDEMNSNMDFSTRLNEAQQEWICMQNENKRYAEDLQEEVAALNAQRLSLEEILFSKACGNLNDNSSFDLPAFMRIREDYNAILQSIESHKVNFGTLIWNGREILMYDFDGVNRGWFNSSGQLNQEYSRDFLFELLLDEGQDLDSIRVLKIVTNKVETIELNEEIDEDTINLLGNEGVHCIEDKHGGIFIKDANKHGWVAWGDRHPSSPCAPARLLMSSAHCY